MIATFELVTQLTLGNEGNWYDGSDPRDPNPTMFGVTQRVYDKYRSNVHAAIRSVRSITRAELLDIYKKYWDGTCDKIATLVPLTTIQLFDLSINAGPAVARTLLQRALDLVEDGDIGDLDDDGLLGPLTFSAVTEVAADGEDELLALWLFAERIRFYNELANSPRLRPNLKSWIDRSVRYYNTYLRTVPAW